MFISPVQLNNRRDSQSAHERSAHGGRASHATVSELFGRFRAFERYGPPGDFHMMKICASHVRMVCTVRHTTGFRHRIYIWGLRTQECENRGGTSRESPCARIVRPNTRVIYIKISGVEQNVILLHQPFCSFHLNYAFLNCYQSTSISEFNKLVNLMIYLILTCFNYSAIFYNNLAFFI